MKGVGLPYVRKAIVEGSAETQIFSGPFYFQVLAEKRQLGSKDGPPHQVLVVPLHDRIPLPEVFRLLQDRDTGTVHLNGWGSTHSFMLLCPGLKHRWFFTSARPG